MKVIKIYYLEYCSNCKYLIKKLEEEIVEFEKIDAEENIEEVEKIEDIIKSSTYPIITISENFNLQTIIGYNINQSIVGNIKLLPYLTVNDIIKIIKT